MKSGFISIVGRPNVGKSTLLNKIIGEKIAIVTEKPQTTRNRIQGIYTSDMGQIIFVDTPGVHKPKHLLGEYMLRVFAQTISEADLIYYVVDATRSLGSGEMYIIENMSNTNTPIFLIINKIDLLSGANIKEIGDTYQRHLRFSEIIPISAANGTNIDLLVEKSFQYMPEGPMYYPEEDLSDLSISFLASEMVREKVLLLTRDEVPHSIAVEIEEFKFKASNKAYIRAVIYTERNSQKGIIIGNKGAMLKQIGETARQDIETLVGCQVYLDLWVKEKKNWRNNEKDLKKFGYRV